MRMLVALVGGAITKSSRLNRTCASPAPSFLIEPGERPPNERPLHTPAARHGRQSAHALASLASGGQDGASAAAVRRGSGDAPEVWDLIDAAQPPEAAVPPPPK